MGRSREATVCIGVGVYGCNQCPRRVDARSFIGKLINWEVQKGTREGGCERPTLSVM